MGNVGQGSSIGRAQSKSETKNLTLAGKEAIDVDDDIVDRFISRIKDVSSNTF